MALDYRKARGAMVEQQLEARGIRNPRVLDAFREVPRHEFVDPGLINEAYADRPLPIGHGQTISQPYMVGIMTELVDPKKDDRILEIGTGSGYQAAILARLVRSVFTVERIGELAENARQVFARLGFSNILQRVGDGTLGWKAYAPYDGIIVTAGAPEPPPSLMQQLTEGGRLVIPAGSRMGQVLEVVVRRGEVFERESSIACTFVPLYGEEGWRVI